MEWRVGPHGLGLAAHETSSRRSRSRCSFSSLFLISAYFSMGLDWVLGWVGTGRTGVYWSWSGLVRSGPESPRLAPVWFDLVWLGLVKLDPVVTHRPWRIWAWRLAEAITTLPRRMRSAHCAILTPTGSSVKHTIH